MVNFTFKMIVVVLFCAILVSSISSSEVKLLQFKIQEVCLLHKFVKNNFIFRFKRLRAITLHVSHMNIFSIFIANEMMLLK